MGSQVSAFPCCVVFLFLYRLRAFERFGARRTRYYLRGLTRVNARYRARSFRHFIFFARGARVVVRLIMFFRRVMYVIYCGKEVVI